MKTLLLAALPLLSAIAGGDASLHAAPQKTKPRVIREIHLKKPQRFSGGTVSLIEQGNSFWTPTDAPSSPELFGTIVDVPGGLMSNNSPCQWVMGSFDPAVNTADNTWFEPLTGNSFQVTGTWYSTLGYYSVIVSWTNPY